MVETSQVCVTVISHLKSVILYREWRSARVATEAAALCLYMVDCIYPDLR